MQLDIYGFYLARNSSPKNHNYCYRCNKIYTKISELTVSKLHHILWDIAPLQKNLYCQAGYHTGLHQKRVCTSLGISYSCLLMHIFICIEMSSNTYTNARMAGVRIGAHFNSNAYMHEETTTGFGTPISGRKYLNWCTPFSDESQWSGLSTSSVCQVKYVSSFTQCLNIHLFPRIHSHKKCYNDWASQHPST